MKSTIRVQRNGSTKQAKSQAKIGGADTSQSSVVSAAHLNIHGDTNIFQRIVERMHAAGWLAGRQVVMPGLAALNFSKLGRSRMKRMGRLFWKWHFWPPDKKFLERILYLKLPGSFEKSFGYCEMKPIVEELKSTPLSSAEAGVLIDIFMNAGRQWAIDHGKPLNQQQLALGQI
jgi:hypothetical protein